MHRGNCNLTWLIQNYNTCMWYTFCEISWSKTQQCSSEDWTSQNLGGDSPFLPPHDLRHCVDVAHGGISSSTMKLVSATIGSATGSASLMTLVSAMTGSSSPIFSTVKDSLGLRDDEKKLCYLRYFVNNIWDFFSASTVFFHFIAPLKYTIFCQTNVRKCEKIIRMMTEWVLI